MGDGDIRAWLWFFENCTAFDRESGLTAIEFKELDLIGAKEKAFAEELRYSEERNKFDSWHAQSWLKKLWRRCPYPLPMRILIPISSPIIERQKSLFKMKLREIYGFMQKMEMAEMKKEQAHGR